MEPVVWGRVSGCCYDGLTCVKDTADCTWSVAFGRVGVREGRHVWEARVRGNTGRMSIGVGKNLDDVLKPGGVGWMSPACDGHVWYYSSTGSLRVGSRLIQETGVKFGDEDVIILDLDMDRGQLKVERGGAEQLPLVTGLIGEVYVCVAMFFRGASCELRELSLSGGHYKIPCLPCTATPGLPMQASAVTGVSRNSSVPRLVLKDVGDGASTAPGGLASRADPMAAYPLTNGPLAPPAVADAASASLPAAVPRPSPRLGGVTAAPHRLLTPRTLALAEGSAMAAAAERPSTPRSLSSLSTVSSPRGGLAPLCPSGIYPSPRYVSPRTPRSIQQPSPRKPEAVPATLTMSQHKELDAAMRRVEALEERLGAAQADNRRLQQALARTLGSDTDAAEPDSPGPGKVGGASNESLASASEPAGVEVGEGGWVGRGKAASPSGDTDRSSVSDLGPDTRTAPPAPPVLVSAAAQVSPGDLGPDANLLPKHWELDWSSLERVQRIGRGSCGTVWEGRWMFARVAIKEFDTTLACSDAESETYREMVSSFRGEVERLCKLRHPNVLAFFGAVTQPPALCIVTEIMVCDLRQYLQRDARAAVLSQRLSVAKGCACGLLYLHGQSPPVVHRDVKPENFLMSAVGDVKVCDFGLARDRHGTRLNTLHHGGTLCYIAPEVHRGQDFDESCDVYALAVVLWELVTLAFPFHDKPPQAIPGIVGWGGERPTMNALQEAVRQKGEESLEGQVLTSIASVIEACWDQDPKKRLSCAQLYTRLAGALDQLSSIAGDK